MNFDLNDDQRAIQRTAKEFLASRYKPETVRELATSDDDRGFTDEQWAALAELGWPGLVVAEEHGGLGLGTIELVVLQEQLGYALAPTPYLSTIAAGLLIAAAGSDEQQAQWLPKLAAGEARATVAVWEDESGWSPLPGATEPRGTRIAVPDAAAADVLVVAGAEGRHWLVDPAGATITSTPGIDTTRRLSSVELDGSGDEMPGRGDAVDHAYQVIATATAAESVGIAQRTMEMAVQYAKEREQFGRPIGAYQAVSHACAQMLLETEGARSATYYAAWALDNESQGAGPLAASMAKAYATDAGWRVAASSLQVHGGIGFTWEHDLHFFLKRAEANKRAWGDPRWHRERVADLAGV
jgi:alkylation response protein AidB-like acyl-CoA dehydrogenase